MTRGARATEATSDSPVPPLADLHTHVIPGVDDGAPDMEAALDTLSSLYADGVTKVVATPHLQASDPNGSFRDRADRNWPRLAEEASKALDGPELYRGFEIQLDTPHPDLEDEGLRLAGSRFALVEFYAFTIPRASTEILARIVDEGHVPILAHPERYWGYDRGLQIVEEWRDAGALIQLNGGSLIGEYGDGVAAMADRFLRGGLVDVIGSDNHARPSRSLSLRSVWDHLTEQGLEEAATLLLSTNPGRILRDEMPVAVGRLRTRPGLLTRLARAFWGE